MRDLDLRLLRYFVTLAEHWFGQARGLDDFLVVSVEMGLGLGIMHKGELFRGANGLGPDLGDLLVKPPNGAGLVRLAEVASEESMLADARRALAASEHEQAFRLGRGMEKLLERAEAGDAAIVALLRAAGEALGFAIANLIVLFAPPKVILAGAAPAADRAGKRQQRRGAGNDHQAEDDDEIGRQDIMADHRVLAGWWRPPRAGKVCIGRTGGAG